MWNILFTCLQIPREPSMLHFLCCWSCGSVCHKLFQSHISSAQCRLPLEANWKQSGGNDIKTLQTRCDFVRIEHKRPKTKYFRNNPLFLKTSPEFSSFPSHKEHHN